MTTNHVRSIGADIGAGNNETGRKSTRQLLDKIPNVPNLYRHTVNGTYYGIAKLGDKRKEHSLGVTDRKTAERKLAEWKKNLGQIDPDTETTTLNQLIEKFLAININNPDKGTDDSMIVRIRETWKPGMDIRVSKIKPSHIDEWLAVQFNAGEWRHVTYNKYVGLWRKLFRIAVADNMIARDDNPTDKLQESWKRPQKPDRYVPTLDEFQAIVADVRGQQFNAEAEHSADFIEFMGNAGLGQAEARLDALTWEKVDWEHGVLRILRKKTQTHFEVPIYPNLRPMLERLAKKPHKPHDSVLKIADPKKALAGACRRLGFVIEKNGQTKPKFCPRSIRAVQIRRLWRAGVDIKLIAAWQGHQDGGKLILNTYTEVFGADDKEYVNAELAKLNI